MDIADWEERHTDSRAPHRELFGRATLELTFTMLRKPYPALALAVQNAMTLAYPRDDYHTGLAADEVPLRTGDIDRIALALSALSHRMINNAGAGNKQAQVVLVRSLLLDWLMLARNRAGEPAE